MRKTLKELTYELGNQNEFVDAYFQGDYEVVNMYIINLLKLVREKTLEECAITAQTTKFEPDEAILKLPKDSVELEPLKDSNT